ncbi:MAG TPA: ABC transporter substrate-binding protein, partial [Acidimicrobiia bacterium]|nr:ABC transporter substrate-binding protein [Acidimicrobiia bacterium]
MKVQHRTRTGLVVGLLAAVALAGCGSASRQDSKSGRVGTGAEKVTLRLGYFPNITHTPALVGVEKGIFAEKLGSNVTLQTSAFNAGPAAVEAIFNGAIDATYIGPNPAISAFAKSNGEAIRIISGATSGGAYLVVNPSISSPAGLKGKKIATPQLGNTQDVALRSWLKANKLSSNVQGGGDVSIVPQENGQALEAFKAGTIHGAW